MLVAQNQIEAVLALAAEVGRSGIQSGAGERTERMTFELVLEGFAGLE
jgi:hypothetical protein